MIFRSLVSTFAIAFLAGNSALGQQCLSLPEGPILSYTSALSAPKIDTFQAPPATEEVERLGADGKVVVALAIGASGKVISLSILRHAGMGIDESVLESARNWKFEPAKIPKTKTPVPVSAVMDISFRAALVPDDELALRRIHFPFLGRYSRPILVRHRPIPWDKKSGRRGEVLQIQGSLNFKGKLERIEIVRGLDEMTNLETVQALKTWQFHPAYEDNTPRAVEVELEFAPPCASCGKSEQIQIRKVNELTAEAQKLADAGKIDEALETVLKAKEATPFTLLADFLHGKLLLDKGEPANAIEPLLIAKKRLPYEAEVYATLATAYNRLGFFSTAAAYQSCAVRLRPDWAEYVEARAEYRRKAGDEAGFGADTLTVQALRRPASD